MRNLDLGSSIFWLVFSIYIAIESYRLGLGTWQEPGAGYFPFGAALLFGAMSLVVLIQSARSFQPAEQRPAPAEDTRKLNVLLVLIAMLLYAFFLNRLGFVLCTFLLYLFFLKVIVPRRWMKALFVSFGVTAGSYLLFNVLLNTQLPRGILF